MNWFLFGVFLSMPVWLVAGNILGTILGRFSPPPRPVYAQPIPALVDRVAPPAPPVVVNVHVAAPLPWTAAQPMPAAVTRVVDAMPVLPAGEVPS